MTMRWTLIIKQLLLVLGILLLIPSLTSAQLTNPQRLAELVRAVAKYTTWPASKENEETLIIGILGEDDTVASLQALEGKTVDGRKISIRIFSSITEARGGHILYIATSKRDTVDRILRELKGSAVLTVSKLSDFVRAGGMIEFDQVGDELAFRVGNTVAESEGLQLSSKALQFAKSVK